MSHTVIHIHLVSEEAGGTLSLANRAASSLWPSVPIVEHIHPPLLSRDFLGGVLRDIERQPGIVLYSLSDPVTIRNLKEGCAAIGSRAMAMPKSSVDVSSVAPDTSLNSMMRLHLELPPRTLFRPAAGIFAGFLALQALWLLPPALMRPRVAFPPSDAAAAQTAASQAGDAHASALIGIVRGDLWADYALALASEPLRTFEDGNAMAAPRLIDAARSAARRAAELAPHDSRVWLLLAALDSQIDQYKGNVSNELKNSYYTGPNERALRPLRISIAAASNAISDSELQSLVKQEIRTIVTNESTLKPSIINAYRQGSAEGKLFLEQALAELDPDMLDILRKG
jgi:hypothetical protein